jgi:hypothetical protein
MAWWVLALFICVHAWTLALIVAILRRLYIDKPLPIPTIKPSVLIPPLAEPNVDDNREVDNELLVVSNTKIVRKRAFSDATLALHSTNVWWRLSDYCESLDDPKTPKDKAMSNLYKYYISDAARQRTNLEDGYGGMIHAIVQLRLWLQYLAPRTMVMLTMVPVCLVLVGTWNLWMPLLVNSGVAGNNHTLVYSGNSELYEWHIVAGERRAVPYCKHYDQAKNVYNDEVRLLLSKDMLHDEAPHARCIVHLPPQEASDSHVWRIENTTATLLDMTHHSSVAAILKRAQRTIVGAIHMPPHLYVLRNGERYLRVTIRKADGSGFEPRMVSEHDLLQLLDRWQRDISESMLNVNLHYCMCPAFMGILDNMTFFFDTNTNQWEIWMQPRVKSVNVLSAKGARRMKFSEKIAPFPYYQNQQILDALPDVHDHLVTQHDAVHIEYIDPARVQLPDDLDSRERFWMGHGTVKRTHEPGNPFALTAPLASLIQVRLITGADSVCYHHCQHISELLAAHM